MINSSISKKNLNNLVNQNLDEKSIPYLKFFFTVSLSSSCCDPSCRAFLRDRRAATKSPKDSCTCGFKSFTGNCNDTEEGNKWKNLVEFIPCRCSESTRSHWTCLSSCEHILWLVPGSALNWNADRGESRCFPGWSWHGRDPPAAGSSFTVKLNDRKLH